VDRLIIKLFGVNKMNFWGWFAAGMLVLVAALGLFALGARAVFAGDDRMMLFSLLTAIFVTLIGIFGVLLSIYCSLLAEKLESTKALRREESGPRAAVEVVEREKSVGFRN
jgi:hypothetical protein